MSTLWSDVLVEGGGVLTCVVLSVVQWSLCEVGGTYEYTLE